MLLLLFLLLQLIFLLLPLFLFLLLLVLLLPGLLHITLQLPLVSSAAPTHAPPTTTYTPRPAAPTHTITAPTTPTDCCCFPLLLRLLLLLHLLLPLLKRLQLPKSSLKQCCSLQTFINPHTMTGLFILYIPGLTHIFYRPE